MVNINAQYQSKKSLSDLKRIQKITAAFNHQVNDNVKFNSSFNFGIAECTQFDNVHDWIKAADQSLHKSKKRISTVPEIQVAENISAV